MILLSNNINGPIQSVRYLLSTTADLEKPQSLSGSQFFFGILQVILLFLKLFGLNEILKYLVYARHTGEVYYIEGLD